MEIQSCKCGSTRAKMVDFLGVCYWRECLDCGNKGPQASTMEEANEKWDEVSCPIPEPED